MDEHAAGPQPGRLEGQPLPEPPTPENLARAEGLVRQARLARQRSDPGLAQKLLDEAVDLAPGSSLVQEALGDDLAERRQTSKARDAYHLAVRLDATNTSAERKYAEAVLKLSLPPDIGVALGGVESYASGRIATLLSAFVPGLGQLVTGKIAKGAAMLSGWVLAWVGLWITPDGIAGILGLFGSGQRERQVDFNPAVLAPIVLGAFCYLWSLYDAGGNAKRTPRPVIEHPVPPVDKPF